MSDICEHLTADVLVRVPPYEICQCTWGCGQLFANEYDPDLPIPLVVAVHPAKWAEPSKWDDHTSEKKQVVWHPPGRTVMQYTVGWGLKSPHSDGV